MAACSTCGGWGGQAFKLFRERTGVDQHFWVHLKKSVPAGAGLGGGSGNAATALWAANAMCGTNLSDETLMEWSGDLGSDCPIFFSHGAAYCTGDNRLHTRRAQDFAACGSVQSFLDSSALSSAVWGSAGRLR